MAKWKVVENKFGDVMATWDGDMPKGEELLSLPPIPVLSTQRLLVKGVPKVVGAAAVTKDGQKLIPLLQDAFGDDIWCSPEMYNCFPGFADGQVNAAGVFVLFRTAKPGQYIIPTVLSKGSPYLKPAIGMAERGETFRNTAVRELWEETEIKVASVKLRPLAEWEFVQKYGGASFKALTKCYYVLLPESSMPQAWQEAAKQNEKWQEKGILEIPIKEHAEVTKVVMLTSGVLEDLAAVTKAGLSAHDLACARHAVDKAGRAFNHLVSFKFV